MLGRIKDIVKKWTSINEEDILHGIFEDKNLQKTILDLNRIGQLFEKGLQADGTHTGDYSPVSVNVYGKRAGHITLYDTGDFYKSFLFVNLDGGFMISADTLKDVSDFVSMNQAGSGVKIDLTDRWHHPLGLTKQSIGELRPAVREAIMKAVRQKLAA